MPHQQGLGLQQCTVAVKDLAHSLLWGIAHVRYDVRSDVMRNKIKKWIFNAVEL